MEIHPDDVIGKVVEVNFDVKRRSPTRFEFHSLNEQDLIGNGDVVFSGADSSLLIQFSKGQKLLIGQNSLVVLRELDGKLDIKVEKGALSGVFTKPEEVLFTTDEEEIKLNGEEQAQFSIAYRPGLGLDVAGYDKSLKVDYKGDTSDIRNKKIRVSEKTGIEQEEKKSNEADGRESRSTASQQKPAAAPPPEGIDIEEVKDLQRAQLNINAPFPEDGQVFLHTQGGDISLFPKEQCLNSCTLTVSIDGNPFHSGDYEKNKVPLFKLPFKPGREFTVNWTLIDGLDERSGSFLILKNNEANFTRAFKEQRPIEVMN